MNAFDPDGRKIAFLKGESPENVVAFNAIINKVGRTDGKFAARLTTLIKSDHIHIIASPATAAKSKIKSVRKAAAQAPKNIGAAPQKNESNGEGTSTFTIFDPTKTESGKTRTGNDFTSSPEATFTHEVLDHAYQKDQGTIDRTIGSSGAPKHEEDAVGFADEYRSIVGEDLREDY